MWDHAWNLNWVLDEHHRKNLWKGYVILIVISPAPPKRLQPLLIRLSRSMRTKRLLIKRKMIHSGSSSRQNETQKVAREVERVVERVAKAERVSAQPISSLEYLVGVISIVSTFLVYCMNQLLHNKLIVERFITGSMSFITVSKFSYHHTWELGNRYFWWPVPFTKTIFR